MNDIIKVDLDNDRPTVLARELHQFLQVESKFTVWFDRMCGYGFTEGIDFFPFLGESSGGRPARDAQLTLDTAKEICMIQRNEQGRQARQYFIRVEREWNSPEKIMARALTLAQKEIARLQEKINRDEPLVLFAQSVQVSKSSILVGELAKLLCQNGVKIGQNRLFEWMRQNGYLIDQKGSEYNMPTQRSMEMGWMEMKETVMTQADGKVHIHKTTKITGKGQQYFINIFLRKSKEEENLPEQEGGKS